MANLSENEMQLQLAVAFGQGTGVMPASPEALAFALDEKAALIRRARADWAASRPAFLDLVRRVGQVSATLAIVDRAPEIGRKHIESGLAIVAPVCPCDPALRMQSRQE